jgi:ATP-binding cassette subfamily F protein 3
MAAQAATWQKKYAEVMEGLDRAEALWMAAAQKLEAAQTT